MILEIIGTVGPTFHTVWYSVWPNHHVARFNRLRSTVRNNFHANPTSNFCKNGLLYIPICSNVSPYKTLSCGYRPQNAVRLFRRNTNQHSESLVCRAVLNYRHHIKGWVNSLLDYHRQLLNYCGCQIIAIASSHILQQPVLLMANQIYHSKFILLRIQEVRPTCHTFISFL